jgi:hypothetical protein
MKIIIAAFTIMLTSPAVAFEAFSNEVKLLSDLTSCPSGKILSDPGLPDLWTCILPGAEVVKVFVNADTSNQVANVKFMWNDWTRDSGYGIHTDADMARAWLSAIATRYAPEHVQEVLDAFSGSRDVVINSNDYSLSYTYYKGPAIDERLFVITKTEN